MIGRPSQEIPGLIDTHCHMDVAAFARDYGEVLERARQNGVARFVIPAVAEAGWDRLLAICREEPDCIAALGLHPLYLPAHRNEHLDRLAGLSRETDVAAIGEIGLDYWEAGPERKRQLELFEAQLAIAAEASLPVLIHARKSHDRVLATLRRRRFDQGGIVHAFSGSLQQARAYTELGFKIGVGGTVTFDRANRVRSVARELPLKSLVLETDAPDIPPAAHRHDRNSPEYLPLILDGVAEIRLETRDAIARQTTNNATIILRLEGNEPPASDS